MITSKNNIVKPLLKGRSNVYLVMTNSGKTILVDTSVKIMRCWLMRALENHNALKADYLVFTHSHYDHINNAAYLRNLTGGSTLIHRNEADFLESGTMKIPEGTLAITRGIVKLAHKINFRKGSEPCKADIIVDEEYQFEDCPGIRTLHTPGHSNGSISLIIDNDIAIVGDVMVNVALFKIFPPFADNIPELEATWTKLLNTGCHTFLPSHGHPVSRELFIKKAEQRSKLQINHSA